MGKRTTTDSAGRLIYLKGTTMQDNDATGPGEPALPPVGSVDNFAVQLHELYSSYMRAGFTEAQSVEFAKVHLTVTLASNIGGM